VCRRIGVHASDIREEFKEFKEFEESKEAWREPLWSVHLAN
jgi:hypothetical protein